MSEKTNRYIDPLSDFGFKHLFGGEPNKDIMIDFLNAVFEGEKHITDIIYSPTEYAGDDKDYKKIFFDLMCTGAQGEQFIVEMQRTEQPNFDERCIFYLSRLIHSQKPKGKGGWEVKLKEVYLIALLDFKLKNDPEGHYLQSISLVNIKTRKVFHNGLGFKFLELSKFDKKENELENELDKWVYLLKNMHSLNQIPKYLDKRIFQKIFNIAEMGKLSREDRMLYESDLQKRSDYENCLAFAKENGVEMGFRRGVEEGLVEGRKKGTKEGLEKGTKEGLEKGTKEGLEKGTKEGLRKGKHEMSVEIAKEMKRENFDLIKIAQFTNLSIEEINSL